MLLVPKGEEYPALASLSQHFSDIYNIVCQNPVILDRLPIADLGYYIIAKESIIAQ